MATSLTTTLGTWASVPMGRLGQPLNTFWQLFLVPAHGHRWADHAGQLAVADNGGLLMAGAGGRSLVVAVRPSDQLRFSAVVSTTDGRSWGPVPPLNGTVASLATGADGSDVALVQGPGGQAAVLASSGGNAWRTLLSGTAWGRRGAGRRCAPEALTAVAVLAPGTPVVGTACTRPGTTGVFVAHGKLWAPFGGAHLGGRADGSVVQVLSLRAGGGVVSALFAMGTGRASRLAEGWGRVHGPWRLSAPLAMAPHGSLVSVGPAPRGGEFVLYRVGRTGLRLAVVDGPGRRWRSLPPPPAGTATVAFPGPGVVEALAAHGSTMTVWRLGGTPAHWAPVQRLHVDILYGSSNLR